MARKSKFSNKYLLAALSIVILLLGYLGIRHFFIKQIAYIPSTKIAPNTAQAESKSIASQSAATPDNPSVKQNAPSPSGGQSSDGNFLAPSGSFVSNHRPSLSGNTAPTEEVSTCNTSPGAKCYIEFGQGNAVKKLDVQTADSSGSVNWIWDVAKAGFTEGSWQIKAVATLNGQTKTTEDSFVFEVQP